MSLKLKNTPSLSKIKQQGNTQLKDLTSISGNDELVNLNQPYTDDY